MGGALGFRSADICWPWRGACGLSAFGIHLANRERLDAASPTFGGRAYERGRRTLADASGCEKKLRMRKWLGQALIILAVGSVYWQLFAEMTGASEPWDAPAYWTLAYPGSLIMLGNAGFSSGVEDGSPGYCLPSRSFRSSG